MDCHIRLGEADVLTNNMETHQDTPGENMGLLVTGVCLPCQPHFGIYKYLIHSGSFLSTCLDKQATKTCRASKHHVVTQALTATNPRNKTYW